MRAIVTGMIATYPVGGVVWDYGQYVLGLERLGFEVYYLEDSGLETYDPRAGMYGLDCSYGVAFLAREIEMLSPSMRNRWHFRNCDGRVYGIASEEMAEIVASADVFLNVSGGTLLRDEYMASARKVLIDTDPGWNHFHNYPKWDAEPAWHGTHGYRAHDHFFTYAERIGMSDCILPDMGLVWNPTRPPVVLDCWKPEPPGDTWTTVLTWKNFKQVIEHNGITYGTKEMEFARIRNAPTRTSARLEMAMGGVPAPYDMWREVGWSIVSSEERSIDADVYRSYIQRSRGEFSVAKNVYVAARSGWFSCRTVCYLAAGRPAVVQDTGFSDVIPTGEGLLGFTDLDEAIEAIESVEANYEHHQQAARNAAEQHFASDRVLGDLLSSIGIR